MGGGGAVAKRLTWAFGAMALVTGVAALAPAQARNLPGYAWHDPDWRFEQHERRVKVVIIAGSIGAFLDKPYGRLLHERCTNADIRNLSQVGQGAPQLFTLFRTQVVENPRLPIPGRGTEMWLLFGGGLNSVGTPHRTNRAIRSLFQLAYRRRIGVVAMTLTPWGSEDDVERWTGARALHLLRSTRNVVDFVMGRATPVEALGEYVVERSGVDYANAPWLENERPNIAIDLYDSPLRHHDAEPWPIERAREQLENDRAWRRVVARLSPAERALRLERDARELAQAPQWFLRPEYRGFDHIHPNRAGHRVIADILCPRLPASWECECPGGASSPEP